MDHVGEPCWCLRTITATGLVTDCDNMVLSTILNLVLQIIKYIWVHNIVNAILKKPSVQEKQHHGVWGNYKVNKCGFNIL
jgi:hypothetical protein